MWLIGTCFFFRMCVCRICWFPAFSHVENQNFTMWCARAPCLCVRMRNIRLAYAGLFLWFMLNFVFIYTIHYIILYYNLIIYFFLSLDFVNNIVIRIRWFYRMVWYETVWFLLLLEHVATFIVYNTAVHTHMTVY